ncbi:hypothetical protein HYV44_00910 [Candidatus Microgenomates bacterium]|nr:hypothetical protein [Candidatus Microgenomates bacterium]
MSLLDILKGLSEKCVSWVVFRPSYSDQWTGIVNDAFRATNERGRLILLREIILLWQKVATGLASAEEREDAKQIFGQKFFEAYCKTKFFFAVRDGDRYSLFTIRLCPSNLKVNGESDLDKTKQIVRESPILLEVHGHPRAISAYLDALKGLAERIDF